MCVRVFPPASSKLAYMLYNNNNSIFGPKSDECTNHLICIQSPHQVNYVFHDDAIFRQKWFIKVRLSIEKLIFFFFLNFILCLFLFSVQIYGGRVNEFSEREQLQFLSSSFWSNAIYICMPSGHTRTRKINDKQNQKPQNRL